MSYGVILPITSWGKKKLLIISSLLTVKMTKYLISELKVTRSVSGTLTLLGATDSTGAHTALMERGLSSQRSSESRNNFGQFKDHISLNRSFTKEATKVSNSST